MAIRAAPFEATRIRRLSSASGRRGDPSSDLTGNAGAAEAAIAAGILGKILLVIVLGEIESRRIEDFGGDGRVTLGLHRLLIHCLRGLGGVALRRRKDINPGAILRADVVALPHSLGRVV